MGTNWDLGYKKYRILTQPEIPAANVLYFDLDDSAIYTGPYPLDEAGGGGSSHDYNNLRNKPSIAGVVLQGNLTWAQLGLDVDHAVKMYSNTTAGWNSTPTARSDRNTIYVYTDHQIINDTNIPGLKIGDGVVPIVDLPFIDAKYMEHIQDTTIHITAAERTAWNNKVRCYMNDASSENLIFTIN